MTARKTPDFGAAATARRRRTPATSAASVTAPIALTGEDKRKYTVLIDSSTADDFDARVLTLRRQVGRKIDKSDVFRAFLAMLEEDPELSAQLVRRLKLS